MIGSGLKVERMKDPLMFFRFGCSVNSVHLADVAVLHHQKLGQPAIVVRVALLCTAFNLSIYNLMKPNITRGALEVDVKLIPIR